MNDDVIPKKISELAQTYSATTEVVLGPERSEHEAYLSFARVALRVRDVDVVIELVRNDRHGGDYNLIAVCYQDFEFTDEHPDTLLEILRAILDGRVSQKHNLLGRKRLIVTDRSGQTHWSY